MPEKEIAAIAENARIIVSGYAFTRRDDGQVSILSLRDQYRRSSSWNSAN